MKWAELHKAVNTKYIQNLLRNSYLYHNSFSFLGGVSQISKGLFSIEKNTISSQKRFSFWLTLHRVDHCEFISGFCAEIPPPDI